VSRFEIFPKVKISEGKKNRGEKLPLLSKD
jgi:hypothetical protein